MSKPSAPATVYLALGSNLGDRSVNLNAAIQAIGRQVLVSRSSPVYETPPWGITDQPAFLNQVIAGETRLSPMDLLTFLKQIERDLGRRPGVRYGPRPIDLDILLYNDLVLNLPGLNIPHARLAERAFVLVPLADLAPDLRHPLNGETIGRLLEELDRTGIHPYLPPSAAGDPT